MRLLVIYFLLWTCACSNLLYYPTRQHQFYSPEKLGIAHEDIFFENNLRQKLHGWWLPAKKAKGTIVFFHGNAQNLTSHFLYLAWLPEQGYNVFIFDYPGYGISDKEAKPTPNECLQSGHAALKWVQEHRDSKPLIVYGNSLGGAIALRTVLDIKNEVPIRAVVADSTFISYKKIAAEKLSHFWLTWPFQWLGYLVMSDQYAAGDLKALAPIPSLVIHGQKDVVVEPRFGDEIYEQLEQPKELWSIPDGQHMDVYQAHQRIYRKKLLDWLEKTNRP